MFTETCQYYIKSTKNISLKYHKSYRRPKNTSKMTPGLNTAVQVLRYKLFPYIDIYEHRHIYLTTRHEIALYFSFYSCL